MVAILLLVLGVILLLIIMVAVYIFKTQRQLVNLDELCKNAMSQIAVQLNSTGMPCWHWPNWQDNTPSMSRRRW